MAFFGSKKLTERRYSFNANDLLMSTRVSAIIAFPRSPMSEIIPQQAHLASRSINVFNNQIMLAKDLGQFKCSAVEPFDDCTVLEWVCLLIRIKLTGKVAIKKEARDF